jgi:hypothetical protein
MGTTVTGGYYLTKFPGGVPINADGKRVETLTDDEIAEHIEQGIPARVLNAEEIVAADAALEAAPKKRRGGKKADEEE